MSDGAAGLAIMGVAAAGRLPPAWLFWPDELLGLFWLFWLLGVLKLGKPLGAWPESEIAPQAITNRPAITMTIKGRNLLRFIVFSSKPASCRTPNFLTTKCTGTR